MNLLEVKTVSIFGYAFHFKTYILDLYVDYEWINYKLLLVYISKFVECKEIMKQGKNHENDFM